MKKIIRICHEEVETQLTAVLQEFVRKISLPNSPMPAGPLDRAKGPTDETKGCRSPLELETTTFLVLNK